MVCVTIYFCKRDGKAINDKKKETVNDASRSNFSLIFLILFFCILMQKVLKRSKFQLFENYMHSNNCSFVIRISLLIRQKLFYNIYTMLWSNFTFFNHDLQL